MSSGGIDIAHIKKFGRIDVIITILYKKLNKSAEKSCKGLFNIPKTA